MLESVLEKLLCKTVYNAVVLRREGDIVVEWEQFRNMDFSMVFYHKEAIRLVDRLDEVVRKCKLRYTEIYERAVSAETELCIKSYLRFYLSREIESKYVLLGVLGPMTVQSEYNLGVDASVVEEAVEFVMTQVKEKVPIIY